MNLFITGDRQMSEIYPGMVAIEMLAALSRGDGLVTGVNEGVEGCVRALADAAGVSYATIGNPDTALSNGKPDWDERHAVVAYQCDKAVAIHADPHASSIIKSLLRVMDERTDLRTPADLLA